MDNSVGDRMRCANCGVPRWQTAGGRIVGGVHVCDAAVRQWFAADPGNPDLSVMTLAEAQRAAVTA
jgi:hypothetical protein